MKCSCKTDVFAFEMSAEILKRPGHIDYENISVQAVVCNMHAAVNKF
jgi:hypothetical protein